jgi:hypothetical protein
MKDFDGKCKLQYSSTIERKERAAGGLLKASSKIAMV